MPNTSKITIMTGGKNTVLNPPYGKMPKILNENILSNLCKQYKKEIGNNQYKGRPFPAYDMSLTETNLAMRISEISSFGMTADSMYGCRKKNSRTGTTRK